MTAPRRILIGVGNPFRGDDDAGRAVARLLAERAVPGLVVRESSGEATSLMETWDGFDDVVLVDACRGAGPPGSIHVFPADAVDRVAWLRHASSHSLGVAAAIGLARALGTLPAQLVVYAVEARDTVVGERLSPEVDAAVRRVADRLAAGSRQGPAEAHVPLESAKSAPGSAVARVPLPPQRFRPAGCRMNWPTPRRR